MLRTSFFLIFSLSALVGCVGTVRTESSGAETSTMTPGCDPYNDTDICNAYSCDDNGNLVVTPEPAGASCAGGFCDGYGTCLFAQCDGDVEMPGPPAIPIRGAGAMTTGDFNGDGIVDIAFATGPTVDPFSAPGGVYVALGHGDRTFAAPLVPINLLTDDLDAADLDGDGDLDLVVPGCDLGKIFVLAGNGDGTFADPMGLDFGALPCTVEIADFDGDGDPDLAVMDWSQGGSVSAVANLGGLAFEPLWKLDAEVGPGEILAADFNGDGAMDLAATSSSLDKVTQIQNTGAGFIVADTIPVAQVPKIMQAADFNGDGAVDLAVVCGPGSEVDVLMNQGNGSLLVKAEIASEMELYGLAVADLDANGTLDLVAGAQTTTFAQPILNLGDGTFEPAPPLLVGRLLRTLAAADFDGDGRTDVAVAGEQGIGILANRAGGIPAPAEVGGDILYPSIAVTDLNGDTYPDVLAASSYDGTVHVLTNTSKGSLVETTALYVGGTPSAILTEDLNGDGSPDVLVLDTDVGVVRVISNVGGTLAGVQKISLPDGAKAFTTGDMNGDGRPDIVVTFKDNVVRVLLQQVDGAFEKGPECDAIASADHLAAGDLDGDGFDDLVLTNQDSPYLGVIRGSSVGGCEDSSGASYDVPLRGVALRDLDHSGGLDVIAAVFGGVMVLQDYGKSSLAPVTYPVPEPFADSLAVADMNLDGKLDIVATRRLTTWFLQNPEGGFDLGPSFMTGADGGIGVPADLDRDGRIDMVVADYVYGGVHVLMSRCAP